LNQFGLQLQINSAPRHMWAFQKTRRRSVVDPMDSKNRLEF